MKISNNLKEIVCPICNNKMVNNSSAIKKTTCYQDCIRKCLNCNVAYSNTDNKPTFIYQNPIKNIPSFVNSIHFKDIMRSSLNERNIKNKINKSSFNTSEDALTYTFVNYFYQTNQLSKLVELLYDEINLENYSDIDIYLWGVPINNSDYEFINNLKHILEENFDENKNSFSEPDIIFKVKDFGIIIVEVKYLSANDVICESKISKMNKYIDTDYITDMRKAKKSRHYELLRNWAIGNMISEDRNFILINLGLEKLFKDKNSKLLKDFELAIINDIKRKFIKRSWQQIIEKLEVDNVFQDISKYLKSKIKGKIIV